MSESPVEDNVSIHSDDSNFSVSIKNENKDKLNTLINMELKHSNVYYDLYSKNNILKVDLENLYNSCKRFEHQKKIKSEILEEHYENLMEYQKRSKLQLQEKLSCIIQKLEETNSFFYEAFDDYSYQVLKNSIHFFDNETQRMEKIFLEITEKLNDLQLNGKITESLLNSKVTKISNIDTAINILFEFSMKRPQIEIEETNSKLIAEIKKLEQKRQEIKLKINKHNKDIF